MKRSLDALDIRLLNRLQANSLATAEQLAEHVPLSPSAIARRVRRMRREGVIAADVAVVAPELFEARIQTIVNVALHEQAHHRGLAALRDRLQRCPEVQICFEVSGMFELTLITTTRGMAAFNRFADEMLTADPVVRRYETSFVKKAIKFTLAVPLDPKEVPGS
jgi:Lrp/AsnC family leucine-responsive transcriptional regulator